MEDYKRVVKNMITKYDKQFTEIWKVNPNVYFQPRETMPELWGLLQQLHKNIVVNQKGIHLKEINLKRKSKLR